MPITARKGVHNTMTLLHHLIKGLKKRYIVATLFCPLCMVGEVLCESALPLLLARLIDEGVALGSVDAIKTFGALMVATSLLSLLFGAGGSVLGGVSATAFSANLRHNLFSKIQTLDDSFLKQFTIPSLLTRLTKDITTIQNAFTLATRLCFRAPFLLIVGFVMAFSINPKLALVFCVAIPILATAVYFISRAAFPRFNFMLKKVDSLCAVVEENLRSIRTVKSYTMEAAEQKKANSASVEVKDATVRSESLVITLSPLAQGVLCLAILAILFFGAQFVTKRSMTSGELVSFVSYAFTVLMSVMMIAMIFVDLTLSRASLGRLSEVFSAPSNEKFATALTEQLSTAPNVTEKSNDPTVKASCDFSPSQTFLATVSDCDIQSSLDSPCLPDTKKLDKNTATFSNKKTITAPSATTKLSSQTAKGTAIFSSTQETAKALATQSTQSTFAPLNDKNPLNTPNDFITPSFQNTLSTLAGKSNQPSPTFSDTLSGQAPFATSKTQDTSKTQEALIDTLTLTARSTLFSGTVRSNLLWGNDKALDAELDFALKIACFSEVALDESVKEHGINFSGGQKQRLALGRALVARPKHLILKAALNACDERTVAKIKENLATLTDIKVSFENS